MSSNECDKEDEDNPLLLGGNPHRLTLIAGYEGWNLIVDDVDAMCTELLSRGVKKLIGPMDRPWGISTASFVDPAGRIWEIAK